MSFRLFLLGEIMAAADFEQVRRGGEREGERRGPPVISVGDAGVGVRGWGRPSYLSHSATFLIYPPCPI